MLMPQMTHRVVMDTRFFVDLPLHPKVLIQRAGAGGWAGLSAFKFARKGPVDSYEGELRRANLKALWGNLAYFRRSQRVSGRASRLDFRPFSGLVVALALVDVVLVVVVDVIEHTAVSTNCADW